jgi:hypothetical protein
MEDRREDMREYGRQYGVGMEDRREYGRAWTALRHLTTGRSISVDVEGQHRVKARADPSRVKCGNADPTPARARRWFTA